MICIIFQACAWKVRIRDMVVFKVMIASSVLGATYLNVLSVCKRESGIVVCQGKRERASVNLIFSSNYGFGYPNQIIEIYNPRNIHLTFIMFNGYLFQVSSLIAYTLDIIKCYFFSGM